MKNKDKTIRWFNLTLTVVILMNAIHAMMFVLRDQPVPSGTVVYLTVCALIYSVLDTLDSFFSDET